MKVEQNDPALRIFGDPMTKASPALMAWALKVLRAKRSPHRTPDGETDNG